MGLEEKVKGAKNAVISVPITTGVEIIIPLGARYFTRKRGKINFFPDGTAAKGTIEIPVGAVAVMFPDYHMHGERYIEYGNHVFRSI